MMLLTLLDIITMFISRDALRATILNELKFNGNGFSYRRKLGTHLLFRTQKDLNVRVIRRLLTQKSETHQFRNTNYNTSCVTQSKWKMQRGQMMYKLTETKRRLGAQIWSVCQT